jgi:hypothetical protein
MYICMFKILFPIYPIHGSDQAYVRCGKGAPALVKDATAHQAHLAAHYDGLHVLPPASLSAIVQIKNNVIS